MRDVINERQVTTAQEEELEDRANNPEKYEEEEFDAELEFKLNKSAADKVKLKNYVPYTREEVAELLAASEAPFVAPPSVERQPYPTYSREDVEAFMEEHYAYEAKIKAAKEERENWDSQKTTGSGLKTASTTRPTNYSKG